MLILSLLIFNTNDEGRLMSRKPEENIYDTLFDTTESKLLVSGSKPQIYKEFLECTR